MNYFDLCQLTKEQLVDYLKRLSSAYVPEWHMQTEDPDVGSALALIFADMYSDLIQKSKRIPDKHYIDFLNLQDPLQKSSKGSQGYMTLTLSEGTTSGVGVSKGKQLIGTDLNEENLVFETVEDVFLVPSQLESMYLVNSEADELTVTYDHLESDTMVPFFIFPKHLEPNLQSHLLEFSHPELLNLKCAKAIDICFKNAEDSLDGRALLTLLADAEAAQWLYSKEGKWTSFEAISLTKCGLRLSNSTELFLELPTIRLVLKKPAHLVCEGLTIKPFCGELEADALYANELEVPQKDGYLFGTQFYAYDAFYIASEEAFTKPGSKVELLLDYILDPYPTPFEIPEPQIKWKNVLRKSDIPEIKEKNITVSDMVLEYWNGIGWSKLEAIEFDRQMFSCETGTYQNKTFSFICPDDLEITNVGATSSYWIRMRIMRVENAYTLTGNYFAPKIKRLRINYVFTGAGCEPSEMRLKEFMTETLLSPKETPLTLFKGYEQLAGKALYMQFNRKLEGAPLQILFDIGTVLGKSAPLFRWEMLKWQAGSLRWEPIEVVDDSLSLTQTGILTFIGDVSHAQTSLFGRQGYWLRAVLVNEGALPVLINGVYVNSVRVVQKETMRSQYFDLKSHEYGKELQLDQRQLEHLELWVNEPQLTEEWLKKHQLTYQRILSSDGTLEAQWVKWMEYDETAQMSEHTRGYLADLYEGRVIFGDSVNGYLPEGVSSKNIRIDYAVNKGELGNVDPYKVTRLAEAIPNVNKSFNPLAYIGGKPPESKQDALKRTARSLHHGERVRALMDLDDIIEAADYEIREVLTLQNINALGEYKLGYVTSAVHTKRPICHMDYFRGLKQRLYKELVHKMPCTLMAERNYFIIEPTPITIDVHFRGIIDEMEQYLGVYKAIDAILNQYLDTYNGNRDHGGWHIGELPDEQYLIASLQGIEGLKAVSHLVINAVVRMGYEQVEISLEHLKSQPFIIVKNGQHTIHLGI